jgi:hypothetical protein
MCVEDSHGENRKEISKIWTHGETECNKEKTIEREREKYRRWRIDTYVEREDRK